MRATLAVLAFLLAAAVAAADVVVFVTATG